MNLDHWYKSIVDSNREGPPDKVWEAIQDELDVDLVWGRVDEAMSRQRAKRRIAAIALAASVFLVIATGVVLFYGIRTQTGETGSVADRVSGLTIPGSPDESVVIHPPEESPETGTSAPEIISLPVKVSENELTDASYEMASDPEMPLRDNDLMKTVPLRLSNLVSLKAELVDVSDLYQHMAERAAEETEARPFSSFYAGFAGQLANTWLMNNKTFQGMKRNEFTNTHPSFGKNLGVLLGSNLTDRLDLQTGFFWISQNNQNYNEYLFGKYVSSKLALDYYTLVLRLKYQFLKNNNNHRLTGGGYIGVMKKAIRDISGVTNEIRDEYNTLDYGVVLGYEYPVPLMKRFTLSTGIHTKIGLNNIFSGNELIPDYLNKTHNTSINLSFSLQYSFY